MKIFIFAIGGTGARVLRSLSMLMAAGVEGLNKNTQIYPLIIDYDTENGDKDRAIKCLENYSRIHELTYSDYTVNLQADANGNADAGAANEPKDLMFRCPLYQMKGQLKGSQTTFEMNHTVQTDAKYSDIINYSGLNNDKIVTKELLRSLYNDSNEQETTELHIDTKVGFKGNPNIGSVILNDIINTNAYKDFESFFAAGDRIILVGSIFGGTGSSGIPVLVNHLKTNASKDAIKNAPLSVVLVTPYFNITEPENKTEGYINDKLFNSKTKAALNFYRDEINSKINSIYYVGDRVASTLSHNIGRSKQKNPANIVELLSAMSIVHFIGRTEQDIHADATMGNEWKFGMPQAVDLNKTKELFIRDFDTETRTSIFDHLTALAYAFKYTDEFVEKNPKEIKDSPFYKLLELNEIATLVNDHKKSNEVNDNLNYKGLMLTLEALNDFYDKMKEWVDEIGSNSNGHKLSLFSFSEDFYRVIRGEEKSRKEKSIFGSEKIVPTLVKSDFDSDVVARFSDMFVDKNTKNKLKASPYQYMYLATLSETCKYYAGFSDKKLNQ